VRTQSQPVAATQEFFFGFGFWQYQLVLLALGLSVSAMYWLILGSANPGQAAVFAFIVGNCTSISLRAASPLYSGLPFPADWLAFLVILIPVGALSSLVSAVAWRVIAVRGGESIFRFGWDDVRTGTFVTVLTGVSMHLSRLKRARLEARNRELENQITVGRMKLQTQEAEIKAAHEIQTHLLPREIPQVKGLEVSCAWQPANSVGGDYFDVLTLAPGQISLCLADVSGKGITAALLMANLQAAVRAFAPLIEDPGALCEKLNEVLCGSAAPGKFVTLFYGVIDRDTLTLRFENAGHCSPIVLRGDSVIVLTEGGTVLGLFPHAKYGERQFSLQSADCLLLTTDGVTEAADESDEQFGAERVTASARAARGLGAHGIRTRILDDVSRFCNGNFQDDASLIVVTVE
jgi:sigma-B regulation protein RsbU (phosphoserine phosphatase)